MILNLFNIFLRHNRNNDCNYLNRILHLYEIISNIIRYNYYFVEKNNFFRILLLNEYCMNINHLNVPRYANTSVKIESQLLRG